MANDTNGKSIKVGDVVRRDPTKVHPLINMKDLLTVLNVYGNQIEVKDSSGNPRVFDGWNFTVQEVTKEEDVNYFGATLAAHAEVLAATKAWPNPANSAHEAFAVLHEEFDELKAHVWTKQKNRDLAAMRKEAIQVAAMAIRFAAEVCTEERGRR